MVAVPVTVLRRSRSGSPPPDPPTSPADVSAVNLFLPSNGTYYQQNTGTTPALAGNEIGNWLTGKPGTPGALVGDSARPTRRAEGIEFTTGDFSQLVFSSVLTFTGEFTAWVSAFLSADNPTFVPLANTTDAFRLFTQSGLIRVSRPNYTTISTAYTQSGNVLLRWRRAANGDVFVRATGIAEANLGNFTETVTLGQVGRSQGAGMNGSGSTSRLKSVVTASADLVTTDAARVAAIHAWFLTTDGVSL